MKIFLSIIIFTLFFFNIIFAENINLKCLGQSIETIKDDKIVKYNPGTSTIFHIDLENNFSTRDDMEDIRSYFIKTKNEIIDYEFGYFFAGMLSFSISRINRITGEWNYKGIHDLTEKDYLEIKKRLDIINKSIKNYVPILIKDKEYYEVTKNIDIEQELEKVKILEEEFKDKYFFKDYYKGFWTCNKIEKIF